VLRRITGFVADEQGDMVALLDCGHRQHVRHRPPLFPNAWVLDPAQRAQRVGTALSCPPCGRAEPPDGLRVERTLGPFDAQSIPAALRHEHRTPHGGWARLCVERGALDLVLAVIGAPQTAPRRLRAGDTQAIPPGVPHEVVIVAPVRCLLELLAPEDAPPP
jgi:tellurite resistance-related uncharacterized protein